MNNEDKLEEILKEDLCSIYNYIYGELHNTNGEFIRLRNELCDFLNKNPKINDVCYEGIIKSLDKKDVKALMKWLKYKEKEYSIYEEQLLYTGIRIAYMIFKKSNILKDLT